MKVEIAVVLDKSGSMYTIVDDAIGGYNEFIEQQKKVDGEAKITLAQFATDYNLVYENIDIQDVKKLDKETYCPCGMTALLDAIGKTISSIEARQSKMCPNCLPDKTIVAILTDGAENASKEHTIKSVNALISAKRECNWEFIFLAANQDAFSVGADIGIFAADTTQFVSDSHGTRRAYDSMVETVSCYRNKSK